MFAIHFGGISGFEGSNPEVGFVWRSVSFIMTGNVFGGNVFSLLNMDVSKNRSGPPKWMVYNGKHY